MYKAVIIDDEHLVVESLKSSVEWEKLGFAVAGQASNGFEGAEVIRRLHPDLVFVDIRMPEMSGLELIKTIGRELPAIEFIVISGFAEFSYAQKAIRYGAKDFCLKPFDDSEIESAVRRSKERLDLRSLEEAQRLIPMIEPASGSREEAEELLASLGFPADCGNTPCGHAAGHRPPTFSNETANRVIAYMHEHYGDKELTVIKLSSRFFLNPSYISQLIKKETGATFTEYVTKLRLSHARRLLKTTTLHVRDIGEQCGYEDYFYFSKLFKKTFGVKPMEYRGLENH